MFVNNKIYIQNLDRTYEVQSVDGIDIKFFGSNNKIIIKNKDILFKDCKFYLGENSEIVIDDTPYMVRSLLIAGRKSSNGGGLHKFKIFMCWLSN